MRGAGLILLVFMIALGWHYSRWLCPEWDEAPAVMRLSPREHTIAVAGVGVNAGLYQFADGDLLSGVISLTDDAQAHAPPDNLLVISRENNGESIKIKALENGKKSVVRSWMSASDRILLGIPLHPDRMTLQDWDSLPGVGPKLAQAIIADRQKNGDFVEFETLDRVKGIGPGKLAAWKAYFEVESGKKLKIK